MRCGLLPSKVRLKLLSSLIKQQDPLVRTMTPRAISLVGTTKLVHV